MLIYRVQHRHSGHWVVKFGVNALSQWTTREAAVANAVRRATDYWSRTPTGFRDIIVYADDSEGREEVVWSSKALAGGRARLAR